METTIFKVAGLDVHHKSIQCAVRCHEPTGKVRTESRSFGTTTAQLRSLADYLKSCGVTDVTMESTGVLWKPVWNILEGQFTLLLVNPQHLKRVPGRKTDVSDAAWLAQLLQCGLLRGSFVPPRAVRNLRDLTRHRAKLMDERTRVANRIHKTLEDANIKLATVASDILKDHTEYKDLGRDYFDRLAPERLQRYYIRRLESLGLEVVVKPVPPAGPAA